jgi:hypothetical protein
MVSHPVASGNPVALIRREIGRAAQLGKAASPLTTSKEETNKAIVGRWFTDFWGKTCNLGIVDELAAPDMLKQRSAASIAVNFASAPRKKLC